MNSTTLYYYKPTSNIIIIDLVRQGCIYHGIFFATITAIIYYNNQEEQLKMTRMIVELDEEFKRHGIELKAIFFPKLQIYTFGAIIIVINVVFPLAHFTLEYKFWTLQYLCGCIGFYRTGLNIFYLATVYHQFETLHEILIECTKNKRVSILTKNKRNIFWRMNNTCTKHTLL